MEKDRIRKREEVPEEFTWRLEDMYAGDEAWQAEYEALQSLPAQVAAYKGRLGESAETLLEYLRLEDSIAVRLAKLHCYANCKSDQDTGNSTYQQMRGKAMGIYVAVSSAGAFAAPEIMAIDQDRMNLFFVAQPGLEEYRRTLEKLRRRAAHILSPAEEKLLSAIEEAADSPSRIYSMFHNADLRFPSVTDKDGNEHSLTSGSFIPMMESEDRVLRENTFKTYYSQLGSFRNTVAATLDGQFKALVFHANARHYDNTLQAALDATEVPVEVYLNLIDSVHANLGTMYRYVALRKKLMGLDELHMYDVYAPLVPGAEKKIPIEQAKATVLEALGVLGEDYTGLLREGFENRWLDVYENEGKRSGAYSTGTSLPHPYVLLNHKDTLDSLFTLAHEMGHALHSYHSQKYQPISTSHYVIFVAEVASTCNEVLLMRYLLGKTTDKQERAYLVNHFLNKFKGTVFRQTMFAEFELEMGRMAERGETLTAQTLCQKYKALNEKYFGPDMISDEEIGLEWARIPHFFYNYYVFQYATGFSAAVAIAERILKEGAPAVADYKRFLSGGSSTDPISLLKIAGVDMSTPEPINAALKLFGELVEELEKIQSE